MIGRHFSPVFYPRNPNCVVDLNSSVDVVLPTTAGRKPVRTGATAITSDRRSANIAYTLDR